MKKTANEIRTKIIEMSHKAGTPHLGSALSCTDILTALYFKIMKIENPANENRDRFILSKGHAALALYATLAKKGIITEETLQTYIKNGGKLAEHPTLRSAPGIEAATGSLGHGLPIGLGMAISARKQGRDYNVYVLMSDGECNEGSVWEAAMYAAAQKQDNLIAIIDYNKWQATDRSREVMALEPFAEKWKAFGWNVQEIDGHDIDQIINSLNSIEKGKPNMIIANTIKGKGVSFMEDDNNWHYRIPTEEEVEQARRELS